MDTWKPRSGLSVANHGRGRRWKDPETPSLRIAWALFLGVGLPSVLMATLSILARAGIYLEPIRALWQPWPPDLLKPFLGVAAFTATLGYLAYRVGRRRGFHQGTVAGMTAAWNRIERPVAGFVPDAPPPASARTTPPTRPTPPPESPAAKRGPRPQV